MENKDVVSLQHADYIAASKTRDMWHDVLGGTERLREMHDSYLPKFPLESADDYKARRQSATMVNATAKTLEAFCGLVCQNPIALGDDVPKEIEKLTENIDNKGNHLDVVARDAFQRSFAGYSVILVDSPAAKATDAGTEKALGLRPYFVVYDACDVINWDYRVNEVSRKTELSLIVFKETKSAKKGMFLREKEVYYRVFWLDDTGKVYWQLWKEQKNENKETICVEVTEPAIMTSQVSIPAAIIGKLGDKPPLRDLAYKNLEHAQMYSDYRSIVHKTCVPLPYTTGVSGEEFGNLVQLGGTMFNLPQDATIGFAEVSGASIDKTKQCIDDIKKDMAMLGLAMLAAQPTQGDVTATETMLDSIQETSALQVRANQLKDAIELAFGFMARYLNLGTDKGGSITLGANWNQMVLSETELNTLSNLVSKNQLSLESLLWKLQESQKLPPDITATDELNRIAVQVAEADRREAEKVKNAPTFGKV